LPEDSPLASLLSAERQRAFGEGFAAGSKAGKEELRGSLSVKADWSLAQEVLDRLMFEDVPQTQYAEDAVGQALALAESWRRGRVARFWLDIERYLVSHYQKRMKQLRMDQGAAPAHREVMSLIEGLLNLPVLAARVEKQYAQQAGPE